MKLFELKYVISRHLHILTLLNLENKNICQLLSNDIIIFKLLLFFVD